MEFIRSPYGFRARTSEKQSFSTYNDYLKILPQALVHYGLPKINESLQCEKMCGKPLATLLLRPSRRRIPIVLQRSVGIFERKPLNMGEISAKKVVICDDHEDVLEFLGILMFQAGYEPLLAHNLQETFLQIEKHKPGLILLDIHMPEHDGFEVAEILKKRCVNIPIIFMTAHDNRFSRIYSPTLGAVGFFTKPLDTDALLARVADVFNETAEQPALL